MNSLEICDIWLMIYADEEDYNNDDNDDAWEHANSDVGDRLCMARSCEQLLGEVVLPEKYHDDGDDNDIGITMNITTTIMIMIICW